ncbi:hypothetical protein KKB40_04900 [Patescibacteria group bacterium]|nr:hypothetical protein [Patescibacteria group bacterium]
MSAKKVTVALLIIAVAIGGFVAGLFLLNERQELREEAAVPGGTAEVSISPETGDYDVGDSIATSIYFNPANIAISGIAVRLTYPFSGVTPEVTVADISVNSSLLSSGDWTCPTQNSIQQGGNVVIDIACANTSALGFVANTNTLLANVTLLINRPPEVSPFIIRFDPALSVITKKSDNSDILLIPTSTGSYDIVGAGVVEPTPTEAVGVSPTSVISPTPTAKITTTPTVTPTGVDITATPTATGAGELPEAGVSLPTIMSAGLGILMMIGALVLAL